MPGFLLLREKWGRGGKGGFLAGAGRAIVVLIEGSLIQWLGVYI
jgi:hypothetical protein